MGNWALLIYTYILQCIGCEHRRACKSKKAPPPDPAIGEAARMQQQIAAQQLEFSKQQYADLKRMMDEFAPIQRQLMESQISMNDLMQRQALEGEAFYKQTFRPLEERFAADAAVAGSQEQQDLMRGKAFVDVERQIEAQKSATARQLASMGVNPNSGRFVSAFGGDPAQAALAQVGAGNAAAEAERARGDQMRLAAIQLGRGISGQSLSAASGTTGLAMGANQLGISPIALQQSAGAQYLGGLGSAAGTYGQAANTLLNLHQSNLARHQANRSGGLSSAFGKLVGIGLGSLTGGFGNAAGAALAGKFGSWLGLKPPGG